MTSSRRPSSAVRPRSRRTAPIDPTCRAWARPSRWPTCSGPASPQRPDQLANDRCAWSWCARSCWDASTESSRRARSRLAFCSLPRWIAPGKPSGRRVRPTGSRAKVQPEDEMGVRPRRRWRIDRLAAAERAVRRATEQSGVPKPDIDL